MCVYPPLGGRAGWKYEPEFGFACTNTSVVCLNTVLPAKISSNCIMQKTGMIIKEIFMISLVL